MLEPGFRSKVPQYVGILSRQGPASGFDLRVCLAFVLLALLVYNANMRLITASDNYPARFLPFAVLGFHTMDLDPLEPVVAQGRVAPYWLVRGRDGGLVSQYPVVTPLLVLPLYLPAMAWLHIRGWNDARLDRLARVMEKLSASLIASLAVGLMYLLLRRRADVPTASLLTVAFGFGTSTWVIGSQGLWQHGMAELLLIIALLLVTGRCTAVRAFALGAVCALAAFNRPPDAILAAPIVLYGFWWAERRSLSMVAGAAAVSVPLLFYNIGILGHLLGGYAIVENGEFFRFNLPMGVAGLLFSLGRGLFVFTPFLFALVYGLRRTLDDREGGVLGILFCIAFVIQVALYAKVDWRGGCAYGPRYLTDVLPLLVWMLPPVVAGLRRWERAVFVAAVCFSVAVQIVGAFWYTGKSDEALEVTLSGPRQMNAVWNLRSTPFILEFRHAHAPRDLFMRITGQIDNVKTGGRDATEAPAGTEIVVTGWALADNRSPWRVVATLAPGKGMRPGPGPLGDTIAFQPRLDVDEVMHTNAPSGWRIVLQTAGLAPGGHEIEVSVQGADGGEFRPLEQREIEVTVDGKPQ